VRQLPPWSDTAVGWGTASWPNVQLPFAMLAAFAVLALVSGPLHAEELVLAGERWRITLDPQTLAMTGTPSGRQGLSISLPQQGLGAVEDLHQDGRHASWRLPGQHLGLTVDLDADEVVLAMTASEVGRVVWPVIGATADHRAYILPLHEGLAIPVADRRWAEFLAGESPLDTIGGLSMPFWGVACSGCTLTYLVTNPFANELVFSAGDGGIAVRCTHAFLANQALKRTGFRIALTGASPVDPARRYRQELIASGRFVTLGQKIEHLPDVAKLLGAAHVYLWGSALIARGDFTDLKRLAAALVAASSATAASSAARLWSLMGAAARTLIASLPQKEWVDAYDKGQCAAEFDRLLSRRDLYTPEAWAGVALPAEAMALVASRATLTEAEVGRLNCLLLYSAFPDCLRQVDSWGDGLCPQQLHHFTEAGLDRLWLGSPDWHGLSCRPAVVQQAIAQGYLVGPYDSFNSIQAPGEADTWETSQFDRELYDTGAIVRADGSKRTGFHKKGSMLSPLAAEPWVEKRVSALMEVFHCNSWFIDCDADGELFDDYSSQHPATQEEDMLARLHRMAWIRDTHKAVIGSEGGKSYAASTIHFAHGMMTPVIGWGDADLTSRSSPYYLGSYYPPEGPAVFFKQVPMKEAHRRLYADPLFRLPLFEMVFHDSVVSTHQWGYGSLKFEDPGRVRELLELLYGVPPLYHLNLDEWAKRKDVITAHYAVFSPLHREIALLPMSDFRYLSDDHLVQQTLFGQTVEVIANFGDQAFARADLQVPGHALVAHWLGTSRLSRIPQP